MSLICAICMFRGQADPSNDGEVKCSDDGGWWRLPKETAKCASTCSDCMDGIVAPWQSYKRLVCNGGFSKFGSTDCKWKNEKYVKTK